MSSDGLSSFIMQFGFWTFYDSVRYCCDTVVAVTMVILCIFCVCCMTLHASSIDASDFSAVIQ